MVQIHPAPGFLPMAHSIGPAKKSRNYKNVLFIFRDCLAGAIPLRHLCPLPSGWRVRGRKRLACEAVSVHTRVAKNGLARRGTGAHDQSSSLSWRWLYVLPLAGRGRDPVAAIRSAPVSPKQAPAPPKKQKPRNAIAVSGRSSSRALRASTIAARSRFFIFVSLKTSYPQGTIIMRSHHKGIDCG